MSSIASQHSGCSLPRDGTAGQGLARVGIGAARQGLNYRQARPLDVEDVTCGAGMTRTMRDVTCGAGMARTVGDVTCGAGMARPVGT
jgi:hypothetical protein